MSPGAPAGPPGIPTMPSSPHSSAAGPTPCTPATSTRSWRTTRRTSSCSTSRRPTTASAASTPTARAGPPFFAWQRSGGSFEITELDVTAGADVAFAHALLRCGTPEDLREHPDHRLRLTIGLRKVDGRWVVTHEHHSFPDRS